MKLPGFLREPLVLDEDESAWRMMQSPEGVSLRLKLAGHAERLVALIFDLLIMNLAVILVVLIAVSLLAVRADYALVASLYLLLTFFLRMGYFLGFEMRWRGQTPGKKIMGICVVDREGHALTPMALVARNLMREVEVFIPLSFLFAWQGVDLYFGLLALSWFCVFLGMPLFNRDRLRFGDMVAGTWVVSNDRRWLQEDLTAMPRSESHDKHKFADAELDVYGISELQVLEKLLRRPDSSRKEDAVREVCFRIREKIGWREEVEPEEFLQDYYRELRAHLERHVLFGDRREDKEAMSKRARTTRVAPTK